MDWKLLNNLTQEERTALKHNDPRLDSFANAVEERYQLPKDLLVAVKNAGEISQSTDISPKNARGVMQFIDSTRKDYPHNPLDPMESLDAAGRYFADLIPQYKGNVRAAIAHYNGGGKAGTAELMKERNKLPDQTANYLKRIEQFMEKRTKQ